MKKLSNTESELKKGLTYKNSVVEIPGGKLSHFAGMKFDFPV